MRTKSSQWIRAFSLIFFGLAISTSIAQAQSGLQISYGANGIQTLIYQGRVLEDLNAYSSDSFHIWHMKSTDLSGNTLSTGQYGWGEANNGRSWDAASHTWTYQFIWGTIKLQYVQTGANLDMIVTTANNAGSGIIFDGATIYPMGLHLPQLPVNFYDPGYAQLAFNTTAPSVTVADYGSGEIVSVVPDATRPLYSGFLPTGNGVAYYPAISGTSPDSLATFQPHNDRPVKPGQTDTYTVSLRFAPSGTALATLAADAYASWAATYPQVLHWNDRRAIGTVYLASSPSGNVNQPGGYPNNPRRYFNDPSGNDFDVTTPQGLVAFQARVLSQAQSNVANLKLLGSQGAITWDIEGEQYPQDTSYVCSPDQIAQVSPEMETVITDKKSPYVGMKLDDAYFKTMIAAGMRIGVCIRPQHFTLYGDGTAAQVYLPNSAVAAEIVRKMKFAHDRWGATLFYIDSTVDIDGGTLDASIFKQAAAALPDSLLIPEESTPLHYAYTAPFKTFLFHGDLGTDATVYNYYPQAFSANLINDVDAGTLSKAEAQLTTQVKQGDLLMAHAEYWQENNPTIVQIYQNAGVWTSPTPTPIPAPKPPPAPTPVPPNVNLGIINLTNGAIVKGQITVQGQCRLSLDSAGTFLMVDGTEIGTGRVGSAPFLYGLDTRTLTNGSHTLQLWGHDTGNNTTLSTKVVVKVAN